MSNVPNIIQAMETVFAASFERGRSRDTWKAWRAFLAAVFALPMDADALATYRKHTGRDDVSAEQFREVYAIVGRRGGKSILAALIATYLAVFRDYSAVLQQGEVGVVMLLAADRRQARVLLNYINGFFDSIPMLKRLVLSRTQESLRLTNRIQIEVHTTSFRAIRGYTVVAAIADELAYWRSEDSANPDTEVLGALRPAMSTIPNALLLCISSPYGRRGALWEAHKEFFGKADVPVLVWQAETRAMNPTVSLAVIAREYLRDHAAASAEYGAQFRTDVEAFLSLEIVEACVIPHRFELPPDQDTHYSAFVDPAGGAGADSMTLAIGHRRDNRAVVDLLREVRPPFNPETVTQEFVQDLRRYRVSQVTGDNFAGDYPKGQFRKLGIEYRCAEKNRSRLYLELLPVLTSGQCELLDNKRLISQLLNLERRTSLLGRDAVDHPRGAHDDVSNACAGLVEVLGLGHDLELGLVNLILKEVAKQNATPAGAGPRILQASIDADNGCPVCHSNRFQKVGGTGAFWECATCRAQWRGAQPTGGRDPSPATKPGPAVGTAQSTGAAGAILQYHENCDPCPACGKVGSITRRGPLLHCSACGYEFRGPARPVAQAEGDDPLQRVREFTARIQEGGIPNSPMERRR